jgi:hypothetical protein
MRLITIFPKAFWNGVKLILPSILLVSFPFYMANAQSAADSLSTFINIDSGIVNIDTSLSIHNSSLIIDGGDATHKGQVNIDIADSLGDGSPNAKPGDVVFGAERDGKYDDTDPTAWNCTDPGIIYKAFSHEFDLALCSNSGLPAFEVF